MASGGPHNDSAPPQPAVRIQRPPGVPGGAAPGECPGAGMSARRHRPHLLESSTSRSSISPHHLITSHHHPTPNLPVSSHLEHLSPRTPTLSVSHCGQQCDATAVSSVPLQLLWSAAHHCGQQLTTVLQLEPCIVHHCATTTVWRLVSLYGAPLR